MTSCMSQNQPLQHSHSNLDPDLDLVSELGSDFGLACYKPQDQFPELHLSAKLSKPSGSVCTYKSVNVCTYKSVNAIYGRHAYRAVPLLPTSLGISVYVPNVNANYGRHVGVCLCFCFSPLSGSVCTFQSVNAKYGRHVGMCLCLCFLPLTGTLYNPQQTGCAFASHL